MKGFMKVLSLVGWVSALAAALMGEPAGVLAMLNAGDEKPKK